MAAILALGRAPLSPPTHAAAFPSRAVGVRWEGCPKGHMPWCLLGRLCAPPLSVRLPLAGSDAMCVCWASVALPNILL